MTNAEKKRILWSYRRIDSQIRAAYAELDNVVTLIQSPQLDGMPATSSSEKDLADLIIKRDEILHRILEEIDRKEKARSRINAELDKMVNENERTVLILRYKRGMTFEQIAEEMTYSWRHTLRIHGYALAHFME